MMGLPFLFGSLCLIWFSDSWLLVLFHIEQEMKKKKNKIKVLIYNDQISSIV